MENSVKTIQKIAGGRTLIDNDPFLVYFAL